MSANPIAFDELRRHGYRWMRRNAPNARVLYRHMETQLAFWRAENPGLSAELGVAEGNSVIFSITKWCTDNYKCVRPPSDVKDRREKLASRIVSRIGDLRRAGKRVSCRRVAEMAGTSRMTVSRFLAEDRRRSGERERRDALAPKAKAILSLIEDKVSPGRPLCFDLDRLATVLVPGDVSETPSARSMRRKRIEEAVAALAGFGIHYIRRRGLIAVARGKQPTEAEWDHALRMTPTRVFEDDVPADLVVRKGLFSSPEAVDLMTLSSFLTGRNGNMRDVMRVAALSRVHDIGAMFRTLWRAHEMQVDVQKYVRTAPRYLRLTPEDAKRFISFADFLRSMQCLDDIAPGDDVEAILEKNGYRKLADARGRRRLDFLLFLLRLYNGSSNLYVLADLERRRLWRWNPRASNIENFPSREFWDSIGDYSTANQWDDLDAQSSL